MSNRDIFKDSVRVLAAQVMPREESSAKAQVAALQTSASSKPSVVRSTEDAKSPAHPKPTARKAKQPAALAWLMPRLKVTKQVSIDIPPELDEMVERASCGQRMDKKFPGYKKEIQSVALVEWLERNGWFRPAEVSGDADDQEDGT